MEINLKKIAMIVGLLFFTLILIRHLTNSTTSSSSSTTTTVIRPGSDDHGIKPRNISINHNSYKSQYYN